MAGAKTAGACQSAAAVYDVCAFGAVGDGVANDGPAFQAAFDAAYPTGGTIFVPPGRYSIQSGIFANFLHGGSHVTFQGSGSASVIVAQAPSANLFVVANVDALFVVRDLVFEGIPAQGLYDCALVLMAAYCGLAVVERCAFYGLSCMSGTPGVIFAHQQALHVSACQFIGCRGLYGVITCSQYKGLHVADTNFIDLGELNGAGHAKVGGASWIAILDANPIASAGGQAPLVLERCRLDEGCVYALDISPGTGRLARASVVDCMTNVQQGGHGYRFSRVESVEVRGGWIGYSAIIAPAIELVDCGVSTIAAVQSQSGSASELRADAACRCVKVVESSFPGGIWSDAARTVVVVDGVETVTP